MLSGSTGGGGGLCQPVCRGPVAALLSPALKLLRRSRQRLGSVMRSSTLKAMARAAVSTVVCAASIRQKAARAQLGIAVVLRPCAT